jgi:hypothetical protein
MREMLPHWVNPLEDGAFVLRLYEVLAGRGVSGW